MLDARRVLGTAGSRWRTVTTSPARSGTVSRPVPSTEAVEAKAVEAEVVEALHGGAKPLGPLDAPATFT
jgi:hypothetical protein